MTEDQIKAIAEEYAHYVTDPYKKDPYISQSFVEDGREEISETMEQFLKRLSNRYCIVEREKVMKLYRESEKLMDVYPSMSNGLANKLTTMEQLFGTSMFNQKEE